MQSYTLFPKPPNIFPKIFQENLTAIDYQHIAGGVAKGHKDTKDIFIYRGGFLWKDFFDRREGELKIKNGAEAPRLDKYF